MLRRVPPNDWYGLRVDATRRSQRVWYDVNAEFGRDLLGLGILAGAVFAVGAWTTDDADLAAVAVCLLYVIGLLVLMVRGTRNARRLAETERAP